MIGRTIEEGIVFFFFKKLKMNILEKIYGIPGQEVPKEPDKRVQFRQIIKDQADNQKRGGKIVINRLPNKKVD